MRNVRLQVVVLLALMLTAAAAALGAPWASGQISGLPVVRGPEPLSESRGAQPWRLSALVQRAPAPLPGAPRRSETLPCLVLVHAEAEETRCLDGEPLLRRSLDGSTYELGATSGPARRRYLLWGFATSPAAALSVVLGDGRRIRVPLRRLPARLRSRARWFAWEPGRLDAVRRIVVSDARGRALDRLSESLPPAAVRGVHGLTLETPMRPAGTAAVVAGPLQGDPRARLLLRRLGARLCAEIDRPNLDEPACGPPPRTPGESLTAARGTELGDTVGGVVPPEVAEVVLRPSSGGAAVRVATQPPGPAAGPAAEAVRVFLGRLPFSGLIDLRLLDAAGGTLGTRDVFAAYPVRDGAEDATRPLRRGRVRGGGRFVLRGDRAGFCFALTAPGRARADGGGSTCGLGGVEMLVPCRPRLAAVLAQAAGRRRLRVVTSDGTVLKGTLVRPPGGDRLWLVPVPPRAAPQAVVWRGVRGPRRLSLGRVPAPASQCGYSALPRS
jgi:hypothetical protein